MRRFIAALVLLGVWASPSHAQLFEGPATLTGTGTPTNTPFFTWNVPELGGSVDMLCIDERHFVEQTARYDVVGFRINAIPTGILGALPFQLNNLQVVASYFDFLQNGSFDAGELRSAQVAIWDEMDTRTGSNFGSVSGTTFTDLIPADYTASSGYEYFVMFNKGGLNTDLTAFAGTFDSDGLGDIMQPQIGRVSVPEPGTVMLLASGFLLFGAVRLRRRGFDA